ncbi:hypothetical protein PM8797T_26640 [Gimesia maris DSM 8797]|nr:hypothetical protein PM8797T_26640 [Gimesia maris DSM 8797]
MLFWQPDSEAQHNTIPTQNGFQETRLNSENDCEIRFPQREAEFMCARGAELR